MNSSTANIKLFQSIFKGREDVFALHWERNNKSGYSPAYVFDPYHFRTHKAKGGTMQSYSNKTLMNLSDDQVAKHLSGEQLIGLYPLLTDNTSWFIVADFDEKDWVQACVRFIEACDKVSIPAYLERSRSGNGGHVWIFFDKPLLAQKSRTLILSLLRSSGVVSVFDKNSSFDRVFPNQNKLSGKGYGNLIALPLHGRAVENANSCFIDVVSMQPFPNQWKFLENIKRVSIEHLEQMLLSIADKSLKIYQDETHQKEPNQDVVLEPGELIITLNNTIRLNSAGVQPLLIKYIKEELNFFNTEFIIKKNSGRSTFGKDRYFNFVEEEGNWVFLPKGFIGKLIRFCRDSGLAHRFVDQRKLHLPTPFSFGAILRPYQQALLDNFSKKDIGVIVAPPGSGKTVMALKVVAEKQQPALIIVHRQQLATQWIERIETFLGIPKKEIGRIGQGKAIVGKQITIATIQSLMKADLDSLKDTFGLIIMDECHHIPAQTYRQTIAKFNSYYLYGFTATPFRKYNDGKLIFIHLGEVIAEIKSTEIESHKNPEIVIRNTELDVPFNAKTDRFETLSNILVHDSERNKLILNDIDSELSKGRKVVVLTERKEHIETLQQYLKQSYEAITLSGDDSETSRNTKWKLLNQGNYQVLITTGQLFGEGSDLQNAQCLFLTYPFSFEGKLIQYIGRVQRSEIAPTVYDYRDIKIDYLNRMFLKRNVYYKKFEKQRTLFDLPEEESPKIKIPLFEEQIIERTVKIKIQELEFLYGSFQFTYKLPEYKEELVFDIENLNIRPEFDVLKSYFEKILKTKTVNVNLTAVLDKEGEISAWSAESSDLNKLNREVVESVRFRFAERNFFGMTSIEGKNGLNQELRSGDGNNIYESGEELLEDVLSKGNYRHQLELRYLASRHEASILKVRFVLNPFAFVFLLIGVEQYHIVMETLDTDEATYIWHLEKSLKSLKNDLLVIDKQLNQIRNKGRQAFLESKPNNFSRVIHDYSDERKGLIIWKDALEEKLI